MDSFGQSDPTYYHILLLKIGCIFPVAVMYVMHVYIYKKVHGHLEHFKQKKKIKLYLYIYVCA